MVLTPAKPKTSRVFMRILSILILSILLPGCSEKAREGLANSFEESYGEDFKKTYRSSFVESCVGEDGNDEKKIFCECVADELISKFTAVELVDADRMKKYVQDNAVATCSEKLNSE